MQTKTQAAICWGIGKEWSVEEIDLDGPRQGEVLVRLAAAGLCHSDDHLITGDSPMPLPMIGGHEGAGIVEEVGPGVIGLEPGDHVVLGFIPACGRCLPCSTGHQNLCDLGALIGYGRQADGTSRHHTGEKDLNLMCLLGTFANYTVINEASCIKIDRSHSLHTACLVSCGAVTGWGSAVYAADVGPGDTVVIVGVGGIGASALQGAKLAGAETIIAVDPVEFKRQKATEFGADIVAPSMKEAFPLVQEITKGRMANKVIMAMGVGHGDSFNEALELTAKLGRVVVTNIHPYSENQVTMNMSNLTGMEKQVVGSLFGSANPRADIPKLLELNQRGQFDLGALITQSYALEDVNDGYRDLKVGKNIRGTLTLDASL
ncbi:MAG: NDMA-dependent alcohol dehydrogenase [Actinobacteria bacterium]|nr:NDMA-dependent alcohol dehydrogenase [Actinomycetota bacterium]MSX10287.1 NDMA-dependent alcohol dehydrogenase [Actinomycetota bacterium]MSX67493.1 NDMA-dependent alcohol dehydrogenase [Actinomycetota bacterium]